MFDQLGTDTYNKNIYQVVQVHADTYKLHKPSTDTYNSSYMYWVQTHR